jgi:hypothetical protein
MQNHAEEIATADLSMIRGGQGTKQPNPWRFLGIPDGVPYSPPPIVPPIVPCKTPKYANVAEAELARLSKKP